MDIDKKKLKELGIANDGKKKQFCPKCHSERKHKSDKSLAVYWDTCTAKCHHCGESFFFGKTEKLNNGTSTPPKQPKKPNTKEYKKPPRLTNEEPLDEKMKKWFEDRSIPTEVAESEGIIKVCRKLPQTGNIEKCIAFPYTENGELVNRKYRDGAKNFMLESGAKLIPWRIDHIRDTPECIITEGEMDALSFIVAGRDDVISVPNGAQKNLTYLDDFIESHFENKTRIYIAADTDAKERRRISAL